MATQKTTLDKDGQPYSRINFGRNKQKALCSLKGVLTGIICDEKLKPAELIFLEAWLKEHEFLHDDPDAEDLLDFIGDVLRDGIMTDDEHEDIFRLVEDVIAYKIFDDSKCKDHINVLLSLLKGISADADINDAEILFLQSWLNENVDITDVWPVPELTKKINQILDDGVITDDERRELYQLATQISGNDFNDTGDAADSPIQCFDAVKDITHLGKGFCFTGKFKSGVRAEIEAKAETLGANIIAKKPTFSTHYVVVGSLSSRDWAYSSHGLKIQHAKQMQANGHDIYIISEDQWLDSF